MRLLKVWVSALLQGYSWNLMKKWACCLDSSSGFCHAVFISSEKKWFQESSRPETTATSETKVMSMWLIDADLVAGVNEGVGIPEPNEMGLYWKDASSFFSFYYFFCIRQQSQELKWAAMPEVTYSEVLLLMAHGFLSQPECTGNLCENQIHICWNFHNFLKSCQVWYQWRDCTLKIKVRLSWILGHPNTWRFFSILYYMLRGEGANGVLFMSNMFLCLCLNFLHEN